VLFAYCSEAYGLIITIASETVEGATVGFSAIVSSVPTLVVGITVSQLGFTMLIAEKFAVGIGMYDGFACKSGQDA
jgi:hypothetical protein